MLAAIQKEREKEEAHMAEIKKQEVEDSNSQDGFEHEAEEPMEAKKESKAAVR